MPRKRVPGTVSVEDAAELLGFDAQTLRLILQTGEYPEIGGIATMCASALRKRLPGCALEIHRGLTRRRCLPGAESMESKKKRRSSKAWQQKERPD